MHLSTRANSMGRAMSDRFQQFVAGSRPQATARQEEGALADDPLTVDGYRAVRRVRTFAFPDVWFTDHTGLGQAFQWAHVRRMIKDAAGTRLTLIWSDAEVALVGRHLDTLHEDIQRRIISEFFQVAPDMADSVPAGEPVILSIKIGLPGEGDTSLRGPANLALVVPNP